MKWNREPNTNAERDSLVSRCRRRRRRRSTEAAEPVRMRKYSQRIFAWFHDKRAQQWCRFGNVFSLLRIVWRKKNPYTSRRIVGRSSDVCGQ